MLSSPPPTPDQLRSIQHVCKCKECYHPPPHPPLTSCVASNMCASARNVIIPPPPPTPDQLRSIQHVCKMRWNVKMCTKAHGVLWAVGQLLPPKCTFCTHSASRKTSTACVRYLVTVIMPQFKEVWRCVQAVSDMEAIKDHGFWFGFLGSCYARHWKTGSREDWSSAGLECAGDAHTVLACNSCSCSSVFLHSLQKRTRIFICSNWHFQ